MKRLGLLIAILLLVGTCSAYSSVNVTADTTVVNSPYLEVGIWVIIVGLGVFFFVLSNITTKETGAPIWALLAPFFTFASAYFSTKLQYIMATTYYDTSANTYRVITEHFVYHLDWIATCLLGILFIFSFINMWYILTKAPVERPNRKEIYGSGENNNRE